MMHLQLLAIRTMTRYKLSAGTAADGSDVSIDALELIKYYPTVSLTPSPDPYMVVKSKLKLVRRAAQ